jgi:monoamine oxidase
MTENVAASNPTVVDTLIVGAGLSGATSFCRLCCHFSSSTTSSSHRIALIEARNRAGGRSCTVSECIDGSSSYYSVDLGGQWLGKTHTEMLSLCHEFGLELEEQVFPPPPASPDTGASGSGASLVELAYHPLKELSEEAKQELQNFESFLRASYQRLLEESNDNSNNHREEEYDKVSVRDMIEQHCTLPESKEQCAFFCQTCLAVDPRESSFLFFLYYVFVWSGGGVDGMELLGDGPESFQALKVKGGTQQISETMIEKALEKSTMSAVHAEVYYGCEIGSIQCSKDLVIAKSSTGDQVFHCRHVILAMSPTLFYQKIAFQPVLSKERTALYESMTMGQAVKVIVVFEKPFWKDTTIKENSRTTRASKALSISEIGLVSNIFDSTVGPHPALVCLITGNRAAHYHSIPSPQNRQQVVLDQLLLMYPNYGDPPLAYMEKDWLAEQYSGGCFAAIARPTESSCFAKHKDLLHQAIVKDKVLVAGTESSTQFYGYLEGAVLAGKRAAEEVIALWKT